MSCVAPSTPIVDLKKRKSLWMGIYLASFRQNREFSGERRNSIEERAQVVIEERSLQQTV
jgi:hypothetical protein